MKPPKIDYALLGRASEFYEQYDLKYVEVPWVVPMAAIAATAPDPSLAMQVGTDAGPDVSLLMPHYPYNNCLVGSAEQAFITLDLPKGQYYGITPCFRVEAEQNLLYQEMFMKVELFDTSDDASIDEILDLAMTFFRGRLTEPQGDKLRIVDTDIGKDIYLGDVEIGSYGRRRSSDYGTWVYGTGLALPRFSVAKALVNLF